MSEQVTLQQRYSVRIDAPNEANPSFLFVFVPKGLQQVRGFGGVDKRVPRFIVRAYEQAGALVFDWSITQDDPGPEREEMEQEIATRLKDRARWIGRVTSLVGEIEAWVKELGWSTRCIEKELDDSWVGKHYVPALLMQQDLGRVLLEPIGPSAVETEGIVDLYLMPAYDDIARLYFYDGQWHVHYLPPKAGPSISTREAPAMALSKETIRQVLSHLTQNAA